MNKDEKEKAPGKEKEEKKDTLPEKTETIQSDEIKNAHASGDGAIGRNDIELDNEGTIEISK